MANQSAAAVITGVLLVRPRIGETLHTMLKSMLKHAHRTHARIVVIAPMDFAAVPTITQQPCSVITGNPPAGINTL
ncbi:hypothetical protein D3C80_1496380 [compost metagenome]